MFFSKLPGLFVPDIAFDLGTTNTHVCVQGQGLVLSEPSVLAVRKGTSEVLCDGKAVGRVAKEMIGRTPVSIDAVCPLRDGVIADFDMTEALLRFFIQGVQEGRSWFGSFNPRVLITVPSGMNAIEKRAVFNAAERAGGRKVYLVEEPRAAGLGAGVPIHEARAHMIVDIGGGTTDISILSLADVVVSKSLRIAGDAMDEAIIQHVRRNYNNLIGSNTAEEIKMRLGSAYALDEEHSMTVKGRDLIAGLPRAVTVTSQDVREALAEPIGQIIDAIRGILERTGPELSGDLVENGMTLCGGGVLMPGLSELIQEETGLRVEVADDPLTTVARGASVFLERLDEFREILESADDDL
ncbi:MAG TPA: rod shape-determining protein [Planctomycetota bacterium]|jgi:rod shape-determining protein MreB|nr:rod shape-determining protein [Planctomycetota bacterium]